MAGYDQKIKVKTVYVGEARKFFLFLQKVGRQFSRPIKINFNYIGRGNFDISIDGGSGSIDALLQGLLLNKGLYYYSCTLANKTEVIDNVVLPVFRELIDNRFSNSQSRFLRKHILGKHAQTDFIPGDLKNEYGIRFEVLYRKWDLKIISDKEYLGELDTLLHQYLLDTLGHKPGEKSQVFPKLLVRLNLPFELNSDFKNAFLKVHALRTAALHRLQALKPEDNLDYHSLTIYNYFSLLDEYKEAQKEKFFAIRGKKYKRLKYGEDGWGDVEENKSENKFDWEKFTSGHPCHDCFVKKGHYHIPGCDVERCPRCGHQLISCDCKWDFYKD